MSFPEYGKYDALGLAQVIAKKDVSAREVMEEAIARAEALNPKLNAIVFTDYDQARAAAKAKPGKAIFAGVPMLLKDMRANVAGWPNRSGSRYVPATPSSFESTLVSRFKAAGLIPFGKTNVPEFGILPTTECKLYGPAHNPWNLAHSPGGSSGGSAATVAAGIVPIAHATDGGGSIRIPASACGLVGLESLARPPHARTRSGRRNRRTLRRRFRDQKRARHRCSIGRDLRPGLWRSLFRTGAGRLLPRGYQAQDKAPAHRSHDEDDERHGPRSGGCRRRQEVREIVRESRDTSSNSRTRLSMPAR